MKVHTVRLVCDDCRTERQGQVNVGVDELRDRLARVGWFSDKANDADLCPACIGKTLS